MPTLRAACAVLSPPRGPADTSPERLAFYRDLVEPFGAEVSEELLRAAPHVSHRDLIDTMLAEAPEVRSCDPDLVVVAQALPDVVPFTAIGPYLGHRLGGRATTFGIHAQGLAAPFTALRAVRAFRRSGRSSTAVVAVLEQTTLPSRFPLVHDNGLVDSGVLLVLGTGAGPSVGAVERLPGTAPAGERLRELAAADPGGTLVVTGPWCDPDPAEGLPHHHRVPPGSYCTSVWRALAGHWREWNAGYASVVLCDTDPRTGESHLAVLRCGAGEGGAA